MAQITERRRILLLTPTGNHSASEDQACGALLAAAQEACRNLLVLEQDSFRRGEPDELEKTVVRWGDKVSGVVGSTNVLESMRLGEIAEKLHLLCLVSNNNPAVWQGRSHIFHIGIPTPMIAAGVAESLLRDVGVRRIYVLYDETEFQSFLAKTTAELLQSGGAAVHCQPGSKGFSLSHLQSWKPDLLYLAYSNEALALPLARRLRRAFPNLPLLVGMSLLRETFLASLGELAEGLILVDLFHRGRPQREQQRILMEALQRAGIKIPTANHGFGWDAMNLCALALAEAEGPASSAVKYLESEIQLEGATGYFHFNPRDHNGRATFNLMTLSHVKNGRVEIYHHGG